MTDPVVTPVAAPAAPTPVTHVEATPSVHADASVAVTAVETAAKHEVSAVAARAVTQATKKPWLAVGIVAAVVVALVLIVKFL